MQQEPEKKEARHAIVRKERQAAAVKGVYLSPSHSKSRRHVEDGASRKPGADATRHGLSVATRQRDARRKLAELNRRFHQRRAYVLPPMTCYTMTWVVQRVRSASFPTPQSSLI